MEDNKGPSSLIAGLIDDIEKQREREDWWTLLGLERFETDQHRIQAAFAKRQALLVLEEDRIKDLMADDERDDPNSWNAWLSAEIAQAKESLAAVNIDPNVLGTTGTNISKSTQKSRGPGIRDQDCRLSMSVDGEDSSMVSSSGNLAVRPMKKARTTGSSPTDAPPPSESRTAAGALSLSTAATPGPPAQAPLHSSSAAATPTKLDHIRGILDRIESRGRRGDWWGLLDLHPHERNQHRIRTAYAEWRAFLGIYLSHFAVHEPSLTERIVKGCDIVDGGGRQMELWISILFHPSAGMNESLMFLRFRFHGALCPVSPINIQQIPITRVSDLVLSMSLITERRVRSRTLGVGGKRDNFNDPIAAGSRKCPCSALKSRPWVPAQRA
ncbi:hypothetical protein V8E36_008877 [Tilletia maclaganii]